ncbi:MAG: hypothetical protein ACFCUM_01785 [Bacteroidales bacterium]
MVKTNITISLLTLPFFCSKIKVTKKVPRLRKRAKNHCFFLKTVKLPAQAIGALTFFLQQKKVTKNAALTEKPKNHCFSLKTVNSLRSDSTVFLTKKPVIFLTPIS